MGNPIKLAGKIAQAMSKPAEPEADASEDAVVEANKAYVRKKYGLPDAEGIKKGVAAQKARPPEDFAPSEMPKEEGRSGPSNAPAKQAISDYFNGKRK
jgi:hypothetical protein